MLYQPVGDGTEKVYLYKKKITQEKPIATDLVNITNPIETNQSENLLLTQRTYWVFNDTFAKW